MDCGILGNPAIITSLVSEFFVRSHEGESEADVLIDILQRASAQDSDEVVYEIKHLISGETIKLFRGGQEATDFFQSITDVDGIVGLVRCEILGRKGQID